jgi:hypothetical protein
MIHEERGIPYAEFRGLPRLQRKQVLIAQAPSEDARLAFYLTVHVDL